MSLNFGSISDAAKNVCFKSPSSASVEQKLISNSAPKLGDIKLPNFLNQSISFGKKLEKNLKNFKLPAIKGSDFHASLNFGGSDNLNSSLKNLSVPTTFCVTLGGGLGLDSLHDQISNLLKQIPRVNLQLPPVPNVDLASLIPPLFIDVKLPLNLNLSQTLDIIKNNCLNSILDGLRGLDPLERLKQLLNLASELCAAAQFTKLKAVIDQIQQAQAELIQQALNNITDPLAKLAKLVDMAVDAFTNGAYDMLEEISRLINGVKFDALINFLESLDPSTAIAALMANIRQLVQLQNYGPIQQLLSAIQVIKSRIQGVANLANNLVSVPEVALDALQSELNRLLDIEDILGIQKILAEIQRIRDGVINTIRAMSPAELLAFLPALLQNALQKLDISQYNSILSEAGSKLCQNISSLIPSLPNVPQVDAASIVPSFLQ